MNEYIVEYIHHFADGFCENRADVICAKNYEEAFETARFVFEDVVAVLPRTKKGESK